MQISQKKPGVKLILRLFTVTLTLLASLAGVVFPVQAAVITSTGTGGAWTATTTWVGGAVPLATDAVVIANGATVTTGGNRTCAGITINGSLSMATGNTLTVNGNVSGSGIWITPATTTTISLTGNWSFNGTSTGNGARATFTGTGTQILSGLITTGTGALLVNKTGGSISLGNNITIGTFTQTQGTVDAGNFLLTATTPTLTAGILRVGAATWAANYSFSPTPPAGFTIEYYHANPTINANITYRNLAFSGTDTAGLSGALTIQGNLTNTGGGVLAFGANNVTISGTVAQNIAGFITTGTVTMAKTSNTATLTGNVTAGTLTMNGAGTLNLGVARTHTITGTWTRTAGTLNGGSSTLNLGGAVSGTGGTFTAATGTVNFNGGGAQTIPALAYNNLGTAVGGIKTLSAATTVGGILTVGAGSTLDTANYAVTLNGSFINNGTFTAGSSVITIGGTSANPAIAGFSTTGALNFTRTSSTATLTGNVIAGTLTMNGAGTLNLGVARTHTITGTWTRTAGMLNGGSSTLNLGGAVSGTGGTFTAATGTINFNGGGAQTIPALAYTNLGTAGGGIKTLSAATTVGGTLMVGAGSTLDTANYAVTLNGSFINNGTFTAGSSVITIGGTSTNPAIAGFSTTGALNFTRTSSTATLTGNVTAGTLTINGAGTLNLGVGLTHQINGPVTFRNGILNGGTSTLGLTGNFTGNTGTFTSANGEVVFNGLAAQTINRNVAIVFNNLTINNTVGVINNHSTGGTQVNGTLALAKGPFTLTTSLTLGNGATIVRDAGTLSAVPAFGAVLNVVYIGNNPVTTGNELPVSATILNNLTINKAGGVTLAASRTVNGMLTLTSGNLTTNANTLTIALGGAATGASTASHVVGNLLKVFSSGSQLFTFPIGDPVNYTPIDLVFTNGGTSGSITATTVAVDHPNIGTSGINPSRDANRYWRLTPGGGLASTDYSATFHFVPGDVDSGATPVNFIAQRYSIGWDSPAVGIRAATSTQVNNLNALGDFVVGESNNTSPSVSMINTITNLSEGIDTSSPIQVADILVTDDGLGVNILSLSGVDAGSFEISGTTLRLIAGAVLDFETKPVMNVTVDVDDASIPGSPDQSASLAITITDINEAPSVVLTNTITTLSEGIDTSSPIQVADIIITDDGLGVNILSLSGADAGSFEISGTTLRLIAGVVLDFETNPVMNVTVDVNDATIPGSPEDWASHAITITDTNEAPTVSLANTITTLPEDIDTSIAIQVTDIIITDDGLGVNILSLSGADAGLFEISGMVLRLIPGAVVDFEADPVLNVSVHVDDSSIPGSPEDSVSLSITITDKNEAPTVNLTNTITTLPDGLDMSTRLEAADIVVSDDALGSNELSLHGTDAGLFEIESGKLFLKAGTVLNHIANPSLDVIVAVDDPEVPGMPDDSASLVVTITDGVAPAVTSILRQDPLTSPTNADILLFRVTFDENVQNVGTTDFSTTLSGTNGTINSVNLVSASVYDIEVDGVSGNGIVGIEIAPGNDITDLSGNVLGSTPLVDTRETYTIDNIAIDILSNAGVVGEPGSLEIIDTHTYQSHFTNIMVHFTADAYNPADSAPYDHDDVNNPANYLLIQPGQDGDFNTEGCSSIGNDDQITIDSVIYSNNAGEGPFVATINLGTPLPSGSYRLYICGSTSIVDPAGNPLNNGIDVMFAFVINDPPGPDVGGTGTIRPIFPFGYIPVTGFAPGRMTVLPEQVVSYTPSDLWLEIPRLRVEMDIVGVPYMDGEWDVSWLGSNAGWLDGSAFPTQAGNSVLTGHIWDADNTTGVFYGLNTMWYGDKVIVHAWDTEYVYEVRSVQQVGPGSTAAMMRHEELPWVTLVTCSGFDPVTGDYKYRVLVRAVLVEVK